MLFQLKQTLEEGGNNMPNKDEVLEQKVLEEEGKDLEFKKDEKEDKTPEKEEDTSKDNEVPKKEEEEEENDEKKKKTSYTVEEYNLLNEQYQEMVTKNENLQHQIDELTEFKLTIEKKDKEEMIESFYMLSDEDKKDVLENIDTYSLDDIEAKLSIICVRNKVNFSLDEPKEEEKDDEEVLTYGLNDGENENIPAWVRSLKNTQKANI